MKKFYSILIFCCAILIFAKPIFAQTENSTNENSALQNSILKSNNFNSQVKNSTPNSLSNSAQNSVNSFNANAKSSVPKILGEDVRLVYDDGASFDTAEGYHLYVRKKPGIASILLTETTKDPRGESNNYAFRAAEYNPVNGDEIRYLDGKPLESPEARFSLIDSTPEFDPKFQSAFHIYIPSQIFYGYPWTRNGVVKIEKGTFINIRAFEKKYADYEGGFSDNPFMFDLAKPAPPPKKVSPPAPPPEEFELTDDYSHLAAQTFKKIAGFNGGKMIFSKGPETIIEDINQSLDRIDGECSLDIVFAIDATGSMKDDIEKLRNDWIPVLLGKLRRFRDFRVGLILYRDYGDNFLYKRLPIKYFDFTTDLSEFSKHLSGFKIYGTEGGDIPEAVYEALYAALNFYAWRDEAKRKIILIGDAQAHPKPRGIIKISKDDVEKLSQKKDIVIDTIILPEEKSERSK